MSTPQVGDVINEKYELLQELGRGSMGVVFKALHQLLQTFVAIKFINPELVDNKEARRRFIQEARIGAKVKHPGVISVSDVSANGHVYIVMEYLEGQSLDDVLAEHDNLLTVDHALDIITQILQALKAVHKEGFVHRDLKPENIFLTKEGKVKIMDFGIAKARRAALSATQQEELTKAGIAIGTPNYMSPEQACGSKSLNHQTDIWSLGIMLYEMLTGHLPFVANSPTGVLNRILDSKKNPPLKPSDLNSEVSNELEQAIMMAIQPEMKKRYQDAGKFLDDLQKVPKKIKAVKKPDAGETQLSAREFAPSQKKLVGIVALFTVLLAIVVGTGWQMCSSLNSRSSTYTATPTTATPTPTKTQPTEQPDAAASLADAQIKAETVEPPPTPSSEITSDPEEPPPEKRSKRGKGRGPRKRPEQPPEDPPEKTPSKRLRPILGGEKGPSKRLRPIL